MLKHAHNRASRTLPLLALGLTAALSGPAPAQNAPADPARRARRDGQGKAKRHDQAQGKVKRRYQVHESYNNAGRPWEQAGEQSHGSSNEPALSWGLAYPEVLGGQPLFGYLHVSKADLKRHQYYSLVGAAPLKPFKRLIVLRQMRADAYFVLPKDTIPLNLTSVPVPVTVTLQDGAGQEVGSETVSILPASWEWTSGGTFALSASRVRGGTPVKAMFRVGFDAEHGGVISGNSESRVRVTSSAPLATNLPAFAPLLKGWATFFFTPDKVSKPTTVTITMGGTARQLTILPGE